MKFYDKSILKVSDQSGSISLAGLIVPQFFELLFTNLLGTVNTIILSHYSETAVAAVGIANQIIMMISIVLGLVRIGSSVITSIGLGANDQETVRNATGLGFICSACFAIIVSLITIFFASPIMRWMNAEGQTLSFAIEYFRIRMFFMVVTILTSCLTTFLRCRGHAKPTLLVGVLTNLMNFVLSYMVIFHPQVFRVGGVTGIAYAAVISSVIGLIAAFMFWRKLGCEASFQFDFTLLKKIFRIGLPGSISGISYSVSQTVSTAIIAGFGSTVVAGKIYFTNIFFFVYLFSYSLGLSDSILIGRLVGQENYKKADRLHRQNIRFAIICNVTFSALVWIFGKPILSLFTSQTEIFNMAAIIMGIDIVVEAGRAMNHLGENALNGVGDVIPPMIISSTSCWLISVLFSYILGVRIGLGLVGCWIAFSMDELFRGFCYWIRWKSGKWKKRVV